MLTYISICLYYFDKYQKEPDENSVKIINTTSENNEVVRSVTRSKSTFFKKTGKFYYKKHLISMFEYLRNENIYLG